MKKIALVPVAVFAMMFALPSACDATGCAVRARVVNRAVAVVVTPAVVVADAVLAVQPYYHSYAYDATAAKIESLAKDIEILNLKLQLQQQNGQPSPRTIQRDPVPPGGGWATSDKAKPMPQADQGKEHPGLTVKRQACASCHESGVAKAKGGGFIMFNGGQLVQLSDEDVGKCLEQIAKGRMPKGGPALNADQKSKIMDFVFGE